MDRPRLDPFDLEQPVDRGVRRDADDHAVTPDERADRVTRPGVCTRAA